MDNCNFTFLRPTKRVYFKNQKTKASKEFPTLKKKMRRKLTDVFVQTVLNSVDGISFKRTVVDRHMFSQFPFIFSPLYLQLPFVTSSHRRHRFRLLRCTAISAFCMKIYSKLNICLVHFTLTNVNIVEILIYNVKGLFSCFSSGYALKMLFRFVFFLSQG